MSKWRMEKPCENCPFNSSNPGLHLRKSLRPGRWRGILDGLRQGDSFQCHKTTEEDEETGDTIDGSGLMCAGALAWQEKHCGQPSQLARIMSRLDAIKPTPDLGRPGERR